MNKIKTCAIIGMRNSIYSPFEVNDNREIAKHFDKVYLFFLRNNSVKETPKYNSNIKVIQTKFHFISLFRLIFFSKNFFNSVKLILLSSDVLSEKIKQLLLLPKALLISEKINQNPPDLIHLFWGHYPSLVILNLKKDLNSKITIFLGAYDFRKKLNITRIASTRANIVFTHSKKRIKQVKKFLGNNTKVLCNYRGVQFDQFKTVSTLNGYNKKKYTFCTIGVLEKHKNIEMIIYNFQLIKNKYPKAKLFIVGNGSLESDLKQTVNNLKLENSIKFLGWLSKKKIYRLLLKTQFYLHFSKRDVIPNSIKEAMFSKCFVLSSKTFAIEEIIDDYKNGFLVDPNKTHVVMKIINFCLNNKKSKLITQKAKIKIIKNFDLKKNIKFFLKNIF